MITMRIGFPFNVLILFSGLLFLQSCSVSREYIQQASQTHSLRDIIKSEASMEQKMEKTVEILNRALMNSMSYKSDIRSYRYLKKFLKKNQRELKIITVQLKLYFKRLEPGEKITFSYWLIRQSDFRELLRLIPLVEAKLNWKIKQLQVFSKVYKYIPNNAPFFLG